MVAGLQRGCGCQSRPWTSAWLSVIIGVVDINIETDCSRLTGPDMSLSSSGPWLWGAVHLYQHGPSVARLLGPKIAIVGGPELRHSCGLWW